MNKRLMKKKGRPQVLRTSRLCVFCDANIKKGQSAVSSKNGKVFEHPKCNEDSNGYLGEDGLLLRSKHAGAPRCHLCGWYQIRLDHHIVSEHAIDELDYRTYFSIDPDEKLVAFSEMGFDTPNGIKPVEEVSDSRILINGNLINDRGAGLKNRTNRAIKQENPKNTKRKKKSRGQK